MRKVLSDPDAGLELTPAFPRNYNKKLNEIININAYSESFSFLKKEPDTYLVEDLNRTP